MTVRVSGVIKLSVTWKSQKTIPLFTPVLETVDIVFDPCQEMVKLYGYII